MRERIKPILDSFATLKTRARTSRRTLGEKRMKLIEGFDSNYRYILVAARRARQLQGGAPPVVETTSRKPCRIAQDEIKAGKVKWVIPETPKSAADVAGEIARPAHPIPTRSFRSLDPARRTAWIAIPRSAIHIGDLPRSRWLKELS